LSPKVGKVVPNFESRYGRDRSYWTDGYIQESSYTTVQFLHN